MKYDKPQAHIVFDYIGANPGYGRRYLEEVLSKEIKRSSSSSIISQLLLCGAIRMDANGTLHANWPSFNHETFLTFSKAKRKPHRTKVTTPPVMPMQEFTGELPKLKEEVKDRIPELTVAPPVALAGFLTADYVLERISLAEANKLFRALKSMVTGATV